MTHTQFKEDIFIFDIDGTLANHKGIRGPFEEHKVHLDTPIEPVWKVLRSLALRYRIVFVSGRTAGCYSETVKWLQKQFETEKSKIFGRMNIELYMRQIGDNRKDSIVKKEIYNHHVLPKYNIVGVFDDRMQVCRMLYDNNIFCFNVNQGLIEF